MTVLASGRYVRGRTTLLGPATIDWASMVGRRVFLLTEDAPGGCGLAAGANMAPCAAPTAESGWPPLLIRLDLVSTSQEPHSTSADPVARRVSQYRKNDRRGPSLLFVADPSVSAPPPNLMFVCLFV